MLSWKCVYYYHHHHRKWCVSDVLKNSWIRFLVKNESKLDLSSVDFDGSYTSATQGREEVEYQGRKKRKTTNSLYLSDRQGLPLAISDPVVVNYNDLFNIEIQFEIATGTLEQANTPVEGLFLNADAGFDSKAFRLRREKKGINAKICFNKRNGGTDK